MSIGEIGSEGEMEGGSVEGDGWRKRKEDMREKQME